MARLADLTTPAVSADGVEYRRRLAPRSKNTGVPMPDPVSEPEAYAEWVARSNPANRPVPRCPAENGKCRRTAGQYTTHPGVGYCNQHGGNTTAGKKSAARTFGRDLIQKEKVAIGKFGGDPTTITITPEEALIEEVRRSTAMVRWLEERIGNWSMTDDTELDGLPELMQETMRGNAMYTNQREWLVLYREERQHMVKVAKLTIDAGLSKRMVELAEDQGRMLATAIRQVLDALGLTPDQAAMVPKVVPTILRQIGKATPPPIPDITSLP